MGGHGGAQGESPAIRRMDYVAAYWVGFSIFLSLGLYLLPPEAWAHTPSLIKTVFGNPVISVILFVMLFEHVIFRVKRSA